VSLKKQPSQQLNRYRNNVVLATLPYYCIVKQF